VKVPRLTGTLNRVVSKASMLLGHSRPYNLKVPGSSRTLGIGWGMSKSLDCLDVQEYQAKNVLTSRWTLNH